MRYTAWNQGKRSSREIISQHYSRVIRFKRPVYEPISDRFRKEIFAVALLFWLSRPDPAFVYTCLNVTWKWPKLDGFCARVHIRNTFTQIIHRESREVQHAPMHTFRCINNTCSWIKCRSYFALRHRLRLPESFSKS